MSTARTTLVIDASSYLYAHWSGTGGERDTAGAIRRLVAAFTAKYSACAIVVFDPAEGTTWRHRLFAPYKGDRKPKPDGLVEAIAEARRRAGEDGVLGPEFDEHEADDVVAHCVQSVLDHNGRVVILSRDKDMYQLLSKDRVTIMKNARSSGNGSYEYSYYTCDSLRDEFNLTPQQWPDYRAITGDNSDNWAGAPGLGDVAARKILQHAGTLREAMPIRCNLPITNKQRSALGSFDWELGLELMTLRRDISKHLGVEA
jgi:DNA polymerase I